MNNVAVILAGGSGTRMKSEKNKLLLEINGKPVIRYAVEAFDGIPDINKIIVVFREEDLDELATAVGVADKITFVKGGSTRQQSVKNAVSAIKSADLVIIHDGARPLIKPETITSAISAAKEYGAAAVGVPVKDTIKVVNADKTVKLTPDRATLYAVQTPQIFDFELYKKALAKAEADGKDFTDDCQLFEYIGAPVKMTDGDYSNIKITTPDDIPLAESFLNKEV